METYCPQISTSHLESCVLLGLLQLLFGGQCDVSPFLGRLHIDLQNHPSSCIQTCAIQCLWNPWTGLFTWGSLLMTAEIVGSLIWISHSRLWVICQLILLDNAHDCGILYIRGSISCLSDSNWAGDIDIQWSTMGYCFSLGLVPFPRAVKSSPLLLYLLQRRYLFGCNEGGFVASSYATFI